MRAKSTRDAIAAYRIKSVLYCLQSGDGLAAVRLVMGLAEEGVAAEYRPMRTLADGRATRRDFREALLQQSVIDEWLDRVQEG